MRRVVPFSIFVLVVLSSVGSLAQVPAECLEPGPTGRSAYAVGLTKGHSMIVSAWRAPSIRQSCDNVGRLATAVESMLARLLASEAANPAPTVDSACEFTGWLQGAQDELDAIQANCADTCFLQGRFMGELAAVAYCELAILLGGLGLDELIIRGPVEVCGLSFEIGCDTEFLSRAQLYRNSFGSCSEYTNPPHREVFLRTQNNQCAYDPQDPDDPEP